MILYDSYGEYNKLNIKLNYIYYDTLKSYYIYVNLEWIYMNLYGSYMKMLCGIVNLYNLFTIRRIIITILYKKLSRDCKKMCNKNDQIINIDIYLIIIYVSFYTSL